MGSVLRALVVLAALTGLIGAARADARPLVGVASGPYADAGDHRRLASVGARWAYDWSPGSRLAGGPVEFVPMAWGAGSVTDANVAAWTAARRAGDAAWLLGFNEPDLRGQANMTPDEAVALWPRLQATGLRLVSPAVASPSTRSQTDPGRSWLDDFMTKALARGLRVDAIALHFYGDWTDPGTVRGMERAIRGVRARWQRPVWVTEVGTLPAWRWEGRTPRAAPSPARARTHMRRVTTMLGRLPWVTRVAWFMDRCGGSCATTSLFDAAGRRTALGRELRRLTARSPS